MVSQNDIHNCCMDGSKVGSSVYGSGMAPRIELDLDDQGSQRKTMSVRFPIELREKLLSIAKVETRVRELKKRAGKVSVNSLLVSIAEKYCAGWAEECGGIVPVDIDAPEKSATEIEAKARAAFELRSKPKKPCPKCDGTGECPTCGGSGEERAGHSKK